MALMHTPEAAIGTECPDFKMPGVDGRVYSRSDFNGADAFLIMFICNHCPYVLAVEQRLIALGKHFAGSPVKIAAVCSNDGVKFAADSFPEMKKRAADFGYP